MVRRYLTTPAQSSSSIKRRRELTAGPTSSTAAVHKHPPVCDLAPPLIHNSPPSRSPENCPIQMPAHSTMDGRIGCAIHGQAECQQTHARRVAHQLRGSSTLRLPLAANGISQPAEGSGHRTHAWRLTRSLKLFCEDRGVQEGGGGRRGECMRAPCHGYLPIAVRTAIVVHHRSSG